MRILKKIRKKVFRPRPEDSTLLDYDYDDTAYILKVDEAQNSSAYEDYFQPSFFSFTADIDKSITSHTDAEPDCCTTPFTETTSRRFFSDEDDAADQLIRLHFTNLSPKNSPPMCALSSSSSGSSDEGEDVRLLGESQAKLRHRREKSRKGSAYAFEKYYSDSSFSQSNCTRKNSSSDEDEAGTGIVVEKKMKNPRMVDDPAVLPDKLPLSRNELSRNAEQDNKFTSVSGMDVNEFSRNSASTAKQPGPNTIFSQSSQPCNNNAADTEGDNSCSQVFESSLLSIEAPSPPPLPRAQKRYDQKGNAFVHIYTEGLSTLYESTEESSCSSIDSDLDGNNACSTKSSRTLNEDTRGTKKNIRLHPVEVFAEDIHIRARWALARRQLVREIGHRKRRPKPSPIFFSSTGDYSDSTQPAAPLDAPKRRQRSRGNRNK